MIFTSFDFIYFLITIVCTYWILPFRFKNIFLLIASYFFYGFANPWLLFLILSITLINYFSGILIEKFNNKKKIILIICITLSLLILGYFKYTIFILDNIKIFFQDIDWTLKILLPAGISFYTFQALGYTIDVYRKKHAVEKNIIDFCLFVSFFPQLVAGPIERSNHLLNEIKTKRKWNTENFFQGIDLLFIGFLKKLVVADNVAFYVNMIFDLKEPSTLLVLVGAIGFGIQILADFSSYTDIARGSAKLIGFDLLENFNHPYIARTPSDFWRRWHITLSFWIRDYIYIPLGGNRVSKLRWVINILIVWFLCGLWHGASWNFVVWGLYWGLLIIIFRILGVNEKNSKNTKNIFYYVKNLFQIILMYFLIHLGWLFFRIQNFEELISYFSKKAWLLNESQVPVSIAVLSLFLFFVSPSLLLFITEKWRNKILANPEWKSGYRILSYTILGIIIIIFASTNTEDFYYFQF